MFQLFESNSSFESVNGLNEVGNCANSSPDVSESDNSVSDHETDHEIHEPDNFQQPQINDDQNAEIPQADGRVSKLKAECYYIKETIPGTKLIIQTFVFLYESSQFMCTCLSMYEYYSVSRH